MLVLHMSVGKALDSESLLVHIHTIVTSFINPTYVVSQCIDVIVLTYALVENHIICEMYVEFCVGAPCKSSVLF